MLSRAGLPDIVRPRSGQRCSHPCQGIRFADSSLRSSGDTTRNGRFARPCDRSAYTYTPSGRSPARLASFSRVPPRSALRNCGFVPKPCFCGLSARLSASPLKTLRVFRRLPGPDRGRAWHLWSSSARCSGSRPHSLRRRSRRLRGDTRRNASSAGYRLLALRRVSPRIRRTASPHVAQFGTRPLVPCLTFHKVRFYS